MTSKGTRAAAKQTMENAELASVIRQIVREEITEGFENNLKPIKESLSDLQTNVVSCMSKVKDLETAANAMETTAKLLEEENKWLKTEVHKLKEKTSALESHSRKFNLRIIGLPKGIEDGKPTQFVNKLFYETFGQDALGPSPLINIAHRTGPVDHERRTMIARLNSFEVKRTILRMTSEKGKQGLQYQGHRISIYPDMTSEQREQQASFNEVRALLRTTNLRYGIVQPTKLLITFNKKTYSFTEASKAKDFYMNEIKSTLES